MNAEPLLSPYKGLAAFDESDVDALLFFGRDHDTRIVVANVLASRLTILYGPSGVGKSSLLRAGVIRELRELGRSQAVAAAVFTSWTGDIEAGIEVAARSAITEALGADPGDAAGSLAERLDAWTAALGGELCLVFDQLEEAFVYRSEGPLQRLLPELITRPRLRVNVLLGIRDDALAQLDAFKAEIPGLFGNTLRLDHLDRASGRQAILGPIDRWNKLMAPDEAIEVEPALVEAVLDEVGTDSDRVETTYLQLVLQRLWEVERDRGLNRLELATLSSLGGAERIVESHLERALERLRPAEQDAVAAMFGHLVTPSGSKLAHRAGDLASFAGLERFEAKPVLDLLAQQRILRPLREEDAAGDYERYEIYHDVLGEPIVAWRARHESDRALADERALSRRRHRRLVSLAVGSLVVVVFLSALTIYAFAQRHTARAQARAAQSRELAAAALTQLSVDPELSLALAAKAAQVQPGPRVDAALREALLASRLRHTRAAARPVYAIGVDGGDIVAASHGLLQVLDSALRPKRRLLVPGRFLGIRAAGALMLDPQGLALRSLQSGRIVKRIALHPGVSLRRSDLKTGLTTNYVRVPKPIRLIALAPDGGLVAVSDGGRRFVVINVLNGEARYQIEQPSAVTALAFGPTGRTLASGGEDGDTRLWRAATGERRAVLHGGRGAVRAISFSPRATLVATANSGVARVWHTSDGSLVSPLSGHTNPVLDIAFSPDGRSVATASTDGTARVWKAVTGETLATLRASNNTVTSVRFSRQSDQVISVGDDRIVRLWDARAQPRLTPVARFSRPILRASWSARGVVAVTDDGTSHLIPVNGASTRQSEAGSATVRGAQVVIRGANGRRILLRGHTAPVTSVHFSRDGTSVLTGSRDETARIWNADTGASVRALRGHFGIVRDAEFSPDGQWVVTAGPGTAALWDAGTGRLLFYLGGHQGPLTFASFDASGTRIFTAGLDGTVRTYQCDVCSTGAALLDVVRRRVAKTGRRLTDTEQRKYLGPSSGS